MANSLNDMDAEVRKPCPGQYLLAWELPAIRLAAIISVLGRSIFHDKDGLFRIGHLTCKRQMTRFASTGASA